MWWLSLMSEVQHYRLDNGQCYAVGCREQATITVVYTTWWDGAVWEYRQDYCENDAEHFYLLFSNDEGTLDVWEVVIPSD